MHLITLSHQFIARLRRPSRAWLGWLALTLALGVAMVRADSPHRVGLVVKHGDTVITRCVEFPEDELTGYEVLQRSGLDLKVDLAGMGATVCRLDGQGCNFPAEDCFCQCQGEPCIFWLYWHLRDGNWQFSNMGASSNKVRDGSVEGWVWGEGSPNGDGARPPAIPFEQICAAPPTATPTPVPPTPTETPMPTTTPDATATPLPTPVIHNFSASQMAITAGESVTLSWDLSAATAAYLRTNGAEEGVIAPDSRTLAPTTTTVYTLIARNEGGESRAEITITVNPAPITPGDPSPTPLPTAAPATQAEAAPTEPPAAPQLIFKSTAATLPAGACTQLSWDTQQATAVYLDGIEVESRGSQSACPAQSRTYTLRAIGPGGEQVAQVTLQVDAPLPAGITPPATSTPTALLIAAVPATPVPARRFSVAIDAEKAPSGPGAGWLLYGGALAAMLLLLGIPALLVIIGGVAWWARGRR